MNEPERLKGKGFERFSGNSNPDSRGPPPPSDFHPRRAARMERRDMTIDQPRRPARSAKASSAASTSGERHTRLRGPLVDSMRIPASVSGLR